MRLAGAVAQAGLRRVNDDRPEVLVRFAALKIAAEKVAAAFAHGWARARSGARPRHAGKWGLPYATGGIVSPEHALGARRLHDWGGAPVLIGDRDVSLGRIPQVHFCRAAHQDGTPCWSIAKSPGGLCVRHAGASLAERARWAMNGVRSPAPNHDPARDRPIGRLVPTDEPHRFKIKLDPHGPPEPIHIPMYKDLR